MTKIMPERRANIEHSYQSLVLNESFSKTKKIAESCKIKSWIAPLQIID